MKPSEGIREIWQARPLPAAKDAMAAAIVDYLDEQYSPSSARLLRISPLTLG